MLSFLSRSTSKTEQSRDSSVQEKEISDGQPIPDGVQNVQEPAPHAPLESVPEAPNSSTASQQPLTGHTSSIPSQEPRPRSERRFSWRSLVHPKGVQDHKPSLPSPLEEAEKEAAARQEYIERQILRTRSEKRAHESALVVRELIIGPFAVPSPAPPKSTKVSASAPSSLKKVQKVKSQLLQPKSAQKVIKQLRELPSSDVPVVVGKTATGEPVTSLPKGPIHAVCLPYTDEEANEKRFCRLDKVEAKAAVPPTPSPKSSPTVKDRSLDLSAMSSAAEQIASVTATSYEKLKEVLADLDIVSLITTPDLGLGGPKGGPGLLNGALPSADAIVDGIEQVTPQLMALGYATGKAIMPSHAGIYPPTDRMSVLTYWWGLEIVMPEPSVKFLSNVPSVAHTIVNFLTALAVANGGVREILPFVRYISQYIDAEWRSIESADQGKGVVCAATWIMPAALVPRAWDFPDPPVASDPSADPGEGEGSTDSTAPPANAPAPSSSSAPSVPSPTLLTPPLPEPNHAPVFVVPAGDPAVQAEGVKGNPAEGVPGVTVTPPTPPASETLGKAAGEAVKGLATATGAAAGAAGGAPAVAAA